VHGDELAHARREALLVLLEAAGHDPERLGDVGDLVVRLDDDARVEIPARDGQRARVQRLQRLGHAPREQPARPIARRSAASHAQRERRIGAAAGGGERLAIDGDAEDATGCPLTSWSVPNATEYGWPPTSRGATGDPPFASLSAATVEGMAEPRAARPSRP